MKINKEFEISKTEKEWKHKLTENQYKVLRENGTEPAFDNEFYDNYGKGVYVCAGCGNKLFSSDDKYDSGTGWPSYTRPIQENAVGTSEDNTLPHARIEVHCNKCGGHLGHVFDDGPKPTGLRYCMNSTAMSFLQKKDKDI